MIILTIRTDNPQAEIGLYKDAKELGTVKWEAHRKLAETIHQKIEDLLKSQNKNWQEIDRIVCFNGPGSFTGLRIGLTVGNALAYSLDVPIVGTTGKDWQAKGLEELSSGGNKKIAVPEYGALAHITSPKK